MERKVSSTSDYSHTSSVVIQPHLNGLGKRVIEDMMSTNNNSNNNNYHQDSTFNTQELYEERQKNSNRFMVSTFDNNYNDHNLKYHQQKLSHSTNLDDKPLPLSPPSKDTQHRQQQAEEDLVSDDEFNETIDLEKSISGIIDVDLDDQYEEQLEDDSFDDGSHNHSHSQNNSYPQDEDEELMNYLDNDYEPASPPRSPPRDLDTDKLYGLYEFSGPDPSHCSLQVDEPVYLINDQDSYWWSIKKLSKHEKMERFKRIDMNHLDVESDDEDGKVGFVPAECLETYGERLARLNCFKNEELEKVCAPLAREESAVSLNKKSGSNSSSTNNVAKKSVTFENLGDIIDEYSDEEPKDDHDNIRQNLQFYNDLGAIKPLNTSNQQDQQPEVLSDVYPVDAPLVVPKNNNSKNVLDKSAYSNTITPTLQSSNMFEDLFVKPKQQNKNKEYDDVSIGSFSPDTPVKGKSPLRTEIGDALDDDEEDDQVARNNSLSSLRRSVILDRLTQVTSDIQEQLRLDDDDDDDDEEEEEEEEDLNEEVTPLQSTKSIIHNTSIDDDVGVEEEEEEEEVKGFSFNDSTDSHSHFSNHSLNDSHSQHSRGSRELEELSQEQGSRIATPEKVSRTATPEQLDQSLYSNQSEQSFTTNNSQRSSSNTITNTPIQVKRTRTPDFVNRTPSQERVKNTPVQVKRTPTPEHINRTPSQERVRNTPIQVKRTPTPEHVKRTPSQDRTRSTPLQTTQTPREEIQMTPTHKLLYQQGNNMSPTLQKLLHTPSFNQPPVSQIPTPNSLRSPPNQSYSVSELSYNHLPRNISGVEMEDEEEEDGEEEQSSSEENNHDDSITPLTSMNSLTPIDERRKLKPVHEMFMPILGKFDELAEKLAELDDILK